MFADIDVYREPCGCVWKNGRRIELCPRHKHKDIPLNVIPGRPKRREKVWC